MTRIFHRLFLWKWILCQAVTSVLCLLFRPKTVLHCGTKIRTPLKYLSLHYNLAPYQAEDIWILLTNAIVYWIKIQYVCSCIYWFFYPFWCQTLLQYNSWSYIMLFYHKFYFIFRVGGRIIISVWSMEQRHRKFESQVNYFIILLITRQSI